MVYITGDLHGDLERLEAIKLKKGDTLIICGDFGFVWDGSATEEKILRRLGKKKWNICFLDGTHENFELLDEYEVGVFCGGKAHNISGNLYHLMRGQIFSIEGETYFTMGGGESPDIDMLFENGAWSRREFPSSAELTEGAENIEKCGCKVDYIVTHEPPAKIKSFLRLKSEQPARITGLNAYLDELNDSCEYKRWFFGSMHLDKHVSTSCIAVFKKVVCARNGLISEN
ncbi:MAG TPA: hypothetical protein DDY98_05960 [Ruminococcaceae bacterium]|nr:hypothetical protein [Oscillospiraceae bacterium]